MADLKKLYEEILSCVYFDKDMTGEQVDEAIRLLLFKREEVRTISDTLTRQLKRQLVKRGLAHDQPSPVGTLFRSVPIDTSPPNCVRCASHKPAIAWAKMPRPNVTINGAQLDFITLAVCRECGLEIQKQAAETNAQVEITEFK